MSADYTTDVREAYEYGRLWPDGTFDSLNWSDKDFSRKKFKERAYELTSVPKSLRPVFARQKIVITTDTYTAEPVDEP